MRVDRAMNLKAFFTGSISLYLIKNSIRRDVGPTRNVRRRTLSSWENQEYGTYLKAFWIVLKQSISRLSGRKNPAARRGFMLQVSASSWAPLLGKTLSESPWVTHW